MALPERKSYWGQIDTRDELGESRTENEGAGRMSTESELIDLFLESVDSQGAPGAITTPGDDDCAVVKTGDRYSVLSTDRVNTSPLAFSFGLEDYRSLGRLICAANISDLLSTGVLPTGILVNAYMPRDMDPERLVEIAEGVGEYIRRYDCPLLGGDTKVQDSLVLAGTAFGVAENRDQLRLRTGAEPGDYVVLSGQIGDCFAASLALAELDDPDEFEEFVEEAILDPGVPLELNRKLVARDIGNGGIDVSDGLGGDLHSLATSSDVGLRISAEDLPISDPAREIATRLGFPPTRMAFGFGGDWQFVVTVPEDDLDDIPDAAQVIGRVTDDGKRLLEDGNEPERLPDFAHDDFSSTGFGSEMSHFREGK